MSAKILIPIHIVSLHRSRFLTNDSAGGGSFITKIMKQKFAPPKTFPPILFSVNISLSRKLRLKKCLKRSIKMKNASHAFVFWGSMLAARMLLGGVFVKQTFGKQTIPSPHCSYCRTWFYCSTGKK